MIREQVLFKPAITRNSSIATSILAGKTVPPHGLIKEEVGRETAAGAEGKGMETWLRVYMPVYTHSVVTYPRQFSTLIPFICIIYVSGELQSLYEEACQSGVVTTCRALVAILGNEGVGKTSLVRSLLGMDFLEEHLETNLVDIHKTWVDEEASNWTEESKNVPLILPSH